MTISTSTPAAMDTGGFLDLLRRQRALYDQLDQLSADATELRETNRLLGALLSQLGCPYERR